MKATGNGSAAGRLFPADDTILAAGVFSLLLHLPLLVGAGVLLGGGRKELVKDITAVIEAASMAPLSAGENTDFPTPSGDPVRTGRTAAGERSVTMPPLSGFAPVLLGKTGGAALAERELAPERTPFAPGEQRFSIGKEAARKWAGWYSAEVRRLVKDAFPYKTLRKHRVHGKVVFRVQLAPDGSIKGFWLLQSENPALSEAARTAVRRAAPFPSYGLLGLDFFPPMDFTVRVLPQ